ncbi:MAG: DMT family transporter [Pseudomonadota bacterium]
MSLMSLRLSPNIAGMVWMLVSVLGATGMTIFVRLLAPEMHTAMLAFLRSGFGLILLVPLVIGVGRMRFTLWKLHLARGICFAIALNAGFYALWKLPLATATVLMFMAPVFVTVLAGPVLGESVGIRRWLAVGAAFLGTLIILRPGGDTLEPAVLVAVISAFAFAAGILLGKILANGDGTSATFVSSTVLTALFTFPPALTVWELPQGGVEWAMIAALVLTASLRTYADIRAYAVGEAGFLAPFSYLRLITIGIAGYFLFQEVIDGPTWLGGAIIIGASLYIALREMRLSRRKPVSPGAEPPLPEEIAQPVDLPPARQEP